LWRRRMVEKTDEREETQQLERQSRGREKQGVAGRGVDPPDALTVL
jgi:hypothetical protein